jgi:hypothetical protein
MEFPIVFANKFIISDNGQITRIVFADQIGEEVPTPRYSVILSSADAAGLAELLQKVATEQRRTAEKG